MDPHFLFNALNGVMQDFLRQPQTGGVQPSGIPPVGRGPVEAGRGGWWTLDR